MKKIVAIGGVDPNSTLDSIEEEIVRLSSKKKPKILYFPTASGDDIRNYELVKGIFENNHGCIVDVLFLIKEEPKEEKIKEKILSTDIIYVGGGPVATLMNTFRKYNVDKIIRKASERGTVLAGVSAGAICWGKEYMKFSESDENVIIDCLDYVDFNFCPHYNKEEYSYTEEFNERIEENGLIGIGLDNNCSIEFVDDSYRVIATKDSANAYKIYKTGDNILKKVIKKDCEFRNINELLNI